MLTIPGIPAHDPGIGAHLRLERPLTMARNTQAPIPGMVSIDSDDREH